MRMAMPMGMPKEKKMGRARSHGEWHAFMTATGGNGKWKCQRCEQYTHNRKHHGLGPCPGKPNHGPLFTARVECEGERKGTAAYKAGDNAPSAL